MKRRESTGLRFPRQGLHAHHRRRAGAQVDRAPMGHRRQWPQHDARAKPCPCVACICAREVQALVKRLRAANETTWIDQALKSSATADATKMAAITRYVEHRRRARRAGRSRPCGSPRLVDRRGARPKTRLSADNALPR